VTPARRWRLLPVALLLILLPRTAPAAQPPARGPLRGALNRAVARAAFGNALWGVEVRNLRTGALLYALNEDKSLTPASTLKLLTTAAALDAFGPDATIETTLETAARLDSQGRIMGDVFLVGRGDPMLWGRSEEQPVTPFDRLAGALVAAGVRRIEGRLVGQDGLFVGERRATDWSWGDLMWYYGAEASALVFNNSAVHVKVMPGERVGDPVRIERNPESAYYDVVVTATTAPAGVDSELKMERPLGTNVIRLSGTYPLGAPAKDLFVALEDPARYAATVFEETLAGRGVRVRDGVATSTDPLPPGTRRLAGMASPPMGEILKQINQPSHNLRAEMLLRLLGWRVRGEGSAEAGIEAVKEFLERSSVPTQGFDIRDGSGLSDTNLVTVHGLVTLLAAMHRHPYSQAFESSLPVAGRSGTLKGRLRGTIAEGRVRAKSGSLRHTFALAGYLTTRRNQPLAFAILLNNHTGESSAAYAAINDMVVALASD